MCKHSKREKSERLRIAAAAALTPIEKPDAGQRSRALEKHLVLDLVEGVLGEDDGLKTVVGKNLTRPEDLAHGGREQVLRHALRLAGRDSKTAPRSATGDVCLDLSRGHTVVVLEAWELFHKG
jgi:hypothetical protein